MKWMPELNGLLSFYPAGLLDAKTYLLFIGKNASRPVRLAQFVISLKFGLAQPPVDDSRHK